MQALAERLESVPQIAGRIAGAARLEALRASGTLAQATPAAYVIPMGMRGGTVDSVTGLYRQSMETVIGVVLVLRFAGDATGGRGVETIEPIIKAVVEAVAGWGPDDAIGVFRLVRGELVSMLPGGTLIYQLDFALEDQLRIVR